MDLRLTWEAVLAIIAILGFFSGVVALYVNLQFRNMVEDLVEKLDKRYVQCSDCIIQNSEMDHRMKMLEKELRIDPEG